MAVDIHEVVMKLIGSVTPYADTSIDNQRNENMGELIKLYQQIGDQLRRIGSQTSRFASAQAIHERARKACIAEASEIMDMECVPYGAAKAFEIGMKREDQDVTEAEALERLRSAIVSFENERSAGALCAVGPLEQITIAAQQLWEA